MTKYYMDVPLCWDDAEDIDDFWEDMVTVGYTWMEGSAPVYYGDNAHPGDPAEADIFEVKVPANAPRLIVDKIDGGEFDDEIYEYIMENHAYEQEGCDDDYLYDAWKDRQLEER